MSNVKLSKTGQQRLDSVNPKLKAVVLKAFETVPFDISVLEGIRTKERQLELFNAKPPRTKTMDSYHLTGHAIDLAPYPIDWNDKGRFHELAQHMIAAGKALGVPITWGGTWSTDENAPDAKFYDGPHFQMPRN